MNTKLKCLLLDDELPGLAYLQLLCQQIPQVEVVKSFNNPMALLKQLPDLDFDVCILDIEMPGLNGLELAAAMTGKAVIFTTAYREFALQAFDLQAVDYIRKPVQKERLERAIQKAIALQPAYFAQTVVTWNSSLGKARIFSQDILWVKTGENDKRDKEVYLRNNTTILLKDISFATLVKLLPPYQFAHVSKACLVHLPSVKTHTSSEVILGTPTGDVRFSLSSVYRSAFLLALHQQGQTI